MLVVVTDSVCSFFLTPSNSLVSSLSVEGCKRIAWERKERNEDTFQLKTLFLGLIRQFYSEEISSWTTRKQSHIPNKALKYNSHFRWLIRFKVLGYVQWLFKVIFVSMVSAKGQATRPYHHMSSLQAAEWKSIITVWGVPLKWGKTSLLRREDFSLGMRCFCFLSGASGNCYLF